MSARQLRVIIMSYGRLYRWTNSHPPWTPGALYTLYFFCFFCAVLFLLYLFPWVSVLYLTSFRGSVSHRRVSGGQVRGTGRREHSG